MDIASVFPPLFCRSIFAAFFQNLAKIRYFVRIFSFFLSNFVSRGEISTSIQILHLIRVVVIEIPGGKRNLKINIKYKYYDK